MFDMKVRLANIPLPEPFVAALVGGSLVHVLFPLPFVPPSANWIISGGLLVTGGAAAAVWAVSVARSDDMSRPPRLITAGPYVYSRNPMYIAWLLITLGFALLLNSAWLMFTTLGALVYLNKVTIPAEERNLQQRFGTAYETYRKRVKRWL